MGKCTERKKDYKCKPRKQLLQDVINKMFRKRKPESLLQTNWYKILSMSGYLIMREQQNQKKDESVYVTINEHRHTTSLSSFLKKIRKSKYTSQPDIFQKLQQLQLSDPQNNEQHCEEDVVECEDCLQKKDENENTKEQGYLQGENDQDFYGTQLCQ